MERLTDMDLLKRPIALVLALLMTASLASPAFADLFAFFSVQGDRGAVTLTDGDGTYTVTVTADPGDHRGRSTV